MQLRETKFSVRQIWMGINDAWHWWLAELVAMIPHSVKHSLSHPDDSDVMYIDSSSVSVRHFDNTQSTEVFRSSLDEFDAEEDTRKKRTVIIALPPGIAFTGRYKIPAVAHAKLRQAVSLEVARRSPFLSAGEYFDYKIVGSQENGRILEIEWATAPTDLIENAKMVAQRLGFFPTALGIASPGEKNLKFTLFRQKPAFGFRLKPSAIALLFSMLLFLGSLFYSSYKSYTDAQAADHKTAELKSEAESAQKIKAKAEALQKTVKLVAGRAAEPKVLDILQAATDTLPDGTWVSEFNLNGNELRLAGYSSSASSLPEQLTHAPLFQHPQFRAPITPQANGEAATKLDHFDIGLTVNNRHTSGDSN